MSKKSLSTLIKECGDDFRSLYKHDNKWYAICEKNCVQGGVVGTTPEEAVGNLLKYIKEHAK